MIMSRRWFNVAAAASLVLLVVTVLSWIANPRGQTWHFTIDTGQPITQNNLDLTLTGGVVVVYSTNHWNRWTLRHLTLPMGGFILLFGIFPTIWLLHKPARLDITHCKICGYDLRATPDRCPECGTLFAELPRSPV
jgi:hypothetical protein